MDRDGVLIEDHGYVGRVDQVDLIQTSVPLIKWANDLGILVIVITNQSGVARGLFSQKDCLDVFNHINKLLRSWDAYLDAQYVCPHHPNFPYGGVGECRCRKPYPGLIKQACNDFEIDVNHSIMVGDKRSDVIQMPGLETVLIQGKYLLEKIPDDVHVFSEYSSLQIYIQNKFSRLERRKT